MTPYYEDGTCTIYHGDCREVLPALVSDAAFACTVTDPPYGTGYYATDSDALTPDLLRTLVAVGACAIFGWPENLVAVCVDVGLKPSEWVTWWPTNAAVKAPPSKTLTRESECIAIFGDASRFGTLKVARTRPLHKWVGPKQRGTSHGDPASRFAGDVWTDSAPGVGIHAKGGHPNEKSLSVVSRLIQGMPDGTVLDPFVGGGTTLIAAKQLGRRAIGVELSEAFCEIAARRLAQGSLFEEVS